MFTRLLEKSLCPCESFDFLAKYLITKKFGQKKRRVLQSSLHLLDFGNDSLAEFRWSLAFTS